MTKELTVEQQEDGTYLRSDGVVLQPAETNPYYVMATVYGEYEEGYDLDLAAKNRRIWNAWACEGISEEERTEIAEKMGLSLEELAPLTESECDLVAAALDRRLNYYVTLPDPGLVLFCETHFAKPFALVRCVFAGSANFRSAHFAAYADFDTAHFAKSAYFNTAHFAERVNFDTAHFAGSASFDTAHFAGYVNFRTTHFTASAHFNSAHFADFPDFRTVHFAGPAYFRTVHFAGSADFRTVHFAGPAFFNTAYFGGHADFNTAHFAEFVGFDDGAFEKRTDFGRASFTKWVPSFFQCEMHDNTTFNDKPALWPKVDRNTAEANKNAYRRLRQISAAQQNKDNEQFFLRQEMACDAVLKDDRLSRWVVQGYGLVSDYGYSVGRPGGALLALWLGPVLFFLGLFKPDFWTSLRNPPAWAHLEALGSALGFSFSNLFSFFGLARRHFGDVWATAPDWVHFIGGLQTVFGFIFLFFLGLGLRNRFRLK